MNDSEIQARATIAAALIVSHSVEIPRVPERAAAVDSAARRLRELTDYVYHTIIVSEADTAVG